MMYLTSSRAVDTSYTFPTTQTVDAVAIYGWY